MVGLGKALTATWLVLIISLATPIVANAETIESLYNLYGISYEENTDEDSEKIIKDYDKIKKFVAMFNYIDLSVPDTASQDKIVRQLEKRIDEINNELYGGFDLTFSEILELENEQAEAYKHIQRINNTRNYVNVEVTFPNADKLPTADEYIAAKEKLEELENNKFIGDISNIQVPVSPYGKVTKHNTEVTIISTSIGSDAISLFNGTVVESNLNTVTVKSGNDVYVTYSNLLSTSLVEGDFVEQYERIGTTPKSFEISLCIGDKYCDVGRLFDE